jgi:hypothetical protein
MRRFKVSVRVTSISIIKIEVAKKSTTKTNTTSFKLCFDFESTDGPLNTLSLFIRDPIWSFFEETILKFCL